MYNPFSLVGKTIMVTGASSGIGRAVAVECSKMGASLLITGRNAERLNQTFDQLDGDRHNQIVADLNKTEDFELLLSNAPALDGVVHCAGLTKIIPFSFVNSSVLDEVMNVNFVAPTLISANLIKRKKINKGGSVVFISSVAGVYCTGLSSSIYAASKGAVNGMIKGMALDLAAKNIRVNSVNPGVIETSIFDSGVISKEQLEEEKKRYPLKRYGQPEEVAYAVIYLLSDAASWVTGSNLLIDGGYTLQ